MQQPCSYAATGDGKLDVQRHREEIRRLVAEAPDEPTYCEFKEALSSGTPKENGELVKDVSSFANTDLEALGGHGYIIFGVSNGGRIVGTANNAGDPSSAVRQIVNGNLSRSVGFEYLTCGPGAPLPVMPTVRIVLPRFFSLDGEPMGYDLGQ